MSKHHQIDLVEFRAQSKEELKTLTSFYKSAFAWEYKDWGEEYSDTSDSGMTSAVDLVEESSKNMTLTVIYSEDLDATKKAVTEAGGKVTQDTYDFPGGRRFHFNDPAGNELAVWSE